MQPDTTHVTQQHVQQEDPQQAAPEAGRPGRSRAGGRVRAFLRGDYEEDGTFRPVRLPRWLDLLYGGLIVLFVVTCWVVFFTWLARTQG